METWQSVVIAVVVILVIFQLMRESRITIYRFYSPDCMYCKQSAGEWRSFVRCVRWRPSNLINKVTTRNINISDAKNADLATKFNVTHVPMLVAEVRLSDETKVVGFAGDNTKDEYNLWLDTLLAM